MPDKTSPHIPYVPGEKITKPGIYSGIPLNVYHSGKLVDGPSISSSGLRKIFNKSPAHYWMDSPLNPKSEEDTTPESEKEHFVFGRAAHHLLLGEKAFKRQFAIREAKWDSWRTDAAKQWRAEAIAAGYSVLIPGDVEHIRGMRDALAREPMIAGGLLNGYVERSIIWRDAETGVWLLSRPDAIPTDSGDFADLKCVADVSDYSITKAIAEYGWNQQGALVREACKSVLKIDFLSFVLVFVEKKPPYCVRIETIDPDVLELGHQQNMVALRTFKNCIDTNNWPGPQNSSGQGGYFKFGLDVRDRTVRRIERMRADLALDQPRIKP